MNELYRQLARAIPDRQTSKVSVSGLDPRALREWIDALPLANFTSTSSQLLDRVRAMNKARMVPLQRLEMLEMLRIPVAHCIATANGQILGAAFPLTARKAELAMLTEYFEFDLSVGYIEVLYDFCAARQAIPLFRRSQASLAALRALQHGGQCLQKSYQCYHAPLVGVWQSMHDVYCVIVDLKLHDRKVEGSLFGGGVRPRHVYTHALLMSLINPYSFTFRELPQVNALTQLMARLCDLREVGADIEQGDHLRLVDTLSDVGPGFLVGSDKTGERTLLGIDTQRAQGDIESRINAAGDDADYVDLPNRGGTPLRVEIRLLRDLAVSLAADQSRDFDRLQSEEKMETVVGLHDLHNAMTNGEDFRTFSERVFGSGDAAEPDEVMASWVHINSESTRVSRRPAYVVDQSLRGYRLRWHSGPQGETVRAKVGEVIGLHCNEDGISNWIVGSIRWLRINENGDIEAGVEVLARRALPVAVRLSDDKVPSRAASRGLLLAPLCSDDAGIYSTLMVPSMVSPHLVDRGLVALNIATPRDADHWWRDSGVHRLGATGLLDRSGTYINFRVPSMCRAEHAHDGLAVNPLGDAN